ncbi:methionyl aminopeptidase [Nakamurella sp. UYEF19]|uniref:type I methionyl aminopeptidase n=1 Tax=Nakamurella sp. UYEF19 TaxID=1756392 RepID=UPI003395F65E
MIEYKSPAQIEAIGVAGALVRRTLNAVREAAGPGVRLKELDDLAQRVIADGGGVSAYIGYHPVWAPSPYPRVLCVSVNDVIVHAIPDRSRLRPGDLVSVDLALLVDGWCADAAISFTIGEPSAADRRLMDATEAALAAGIAAARPGGRLGDISAAIGKVIRASGFGLLADHGGHGIGTSMHQEPHVANEGRARRGLKLSPGLVIAIEPMLQAGGRDDYQHCKDGWGIRTADGSRAAHFEHTIAITASGVRILTA